MAFDYYTSVAGYLPLRWNPQMDMTRQSSIGNPTAGIDHIDPNSMQRPQLLDQDPQYEIKSKFGYVGYNPKWRAFSNTVQGIGAFFANRKNQQDAKDYQRQQNNPLLQLPYNPNTSQQSIYGSPEYKGGGWIQKAINPAHKGWCTPLSNPHCTGHRRALALRFKHHKLQEGGDPIPQPTKGAGNAGHKAILSDLMSMGIVNTGNKKELQNQRRILINNATAEFGRGASQKLVTDIVAYTQRPEVQKLTPQQKIASYYGINSNDPDVQNIKNQFKNFGYNPGVLYQNSPDINVQAQSIASRAKGGPTADKAKEMLRDGTAQGHRLTDKQKRYFGWIAGGKKAEGGDVFDEIDMDELRDMKDQLEEQLSSLNQQASNQSIQDEPEAQQEPDESQEEQFDFPQDQGLAELLSSQSSPGDDEEDEPNPVGPVEPGPAPIGSVLPRSSNNSAIQAFKNGIANVEGAGYYEKNKNSSAFGRYQIIDSTREGIRKQFFPNINKKDFDNAYKSDPKFQERIMDVYSSHLLGRYNDPHKAAIAYFLGEGKVGKINEPSYRPTPNNATVGQYLNTFNKGYHFKEGGEYELTNLQIAQLRKQGYQIENI